MLAEEGVPESTYNLTLIPIDVPGAMIRVQTQLTQNMAIERDRHIASNTNKVLLEQAQSGELDEKRLLRMIVSRGSSISFIRLLMVKYQPVLHFSWINSRLSLITKNHLADLTFMRSLVNALSVLVNL